MTITLTPSQLAWVNLPSEQKEVFNNIAYKDGNADLDGYDWFEHLVPEAIQSSPEKVEVFMDGGTVTHEVWVHDQGMANGHYEQVTYEVADKDVSRITSGANGGEYTPDNTVMEDASANRARGGEDMTTEELDSIQEANALEAELLDGGEVLTDVGNSSVEQLTTAANAAEATDGLLDAVLDGLLPVTYGAKAAHATWQATADMDDGERLATTALMGGAAVGTTYAACAFIPGVNLVLGGIALWKVGTAVHKWSNQWAIE